MSSDPISAVWLVISNQIASDERVTLQSGSQKYALIFTDIVVANEFMRDMQDSNLFLEPLETWVFKETFLATLRLLSVTRVMFDYAQGQHNALSAPLDLLQAHCKAQIGTRPAQA